MTETIEATATEKVEEKKEELKPEHKLAKEGFNFKKWLKGSNKREYIENIGFLIIVIATIMISAGIGLGSFIQEIVFTAIFGVFFFMVGIFVYIVSQFIGE